MEAPAAQIEIIAIRFAEIRDAVERRLGAIGQTGEPLPAAPFPLPMLRHFIYTSRQPRYAGLYRSLGR